MDKNYILYNGDCLEIMDKLIKEGVTVDLILTDPPYGTTQCKWDSIIPLDEMWLRLNKLIKPNGAIVLFGCEPFSSLLRYSNLKNYKYDWKWCKSRKTGFLNAKKMPLRCHENISVFYTKQPTYYNTELIELDKPIKSYRKNGKGGNLFNEANCSKDKVQKFTNYNKDLLFFNNEHNVKAFHPTQKPVDLLEYLIKTYTNENELVLDFTMGSGSTGVACMNTNRKFIGIELNEEYFNIAVNRINKEG